MIMEKVLLTIVDRDILGIWWTALILLSYEAVSAGSSNILQSHLSGSCLKKRFTARLNQN